MANADDFKSGEKPVDILNEDIPSAERMASLDPESDVEVPLEADELKEALGRPPPVHSSYLPLPWKGRLGYVSYAARNLPSHGGHNTNSHANRPV